MKCILAKDMIQFNTVIQKVKILLRFWTKVNTSRKTQQIYDYSSESISNHSYSIVTCLQKVKSSPSLGVKNNWTKEQRN